MLNSCYGMSFTNIVTKDIIHIGICDFLECPLYYDTDSVKGSNVEGLNREEITRKLNSCYGYRREE